jgi:hypothetical protein
VFSVLDGSLEFLVFASTLTQIASEYGLAPIIDYGLFPIAGRQGEGGVSCWNDLFEPRDEALVFKHFRPCFPPGTDPSLTLASSLFCAFAFQKQGDIMAKHGTQL